MRAKNERTSDVRAEAPDDFFSIPVSERADEEGDPTLMGRPCRNKASPLTGR